MERICLIVDDEPIIRTYLRAILEKDGYRVLEADSAPLAFRMVQKLGGAVNLIVSDIQMPGDMNGVDLAYATEAAFPAIPVILVSGYAERLFGKQPCGRFRFIQKPFDPAIILEAVKAATGLDTPAWPGR